MSDVVGISKKVFTVTVRIFRSLFIFALIAAITMSGFSAIACASVSNDTAELYAKLAAGTKIKQERSYEKPENPTVYLTFDDGPSKLTPKVLDILQEEGILATFFVCGDQIGSREDTLKRIVREGHTIGNHSYNHTYSDLYASFSKFWDQIQRNEKLIEETVGIRPTLIRAPGGTGTNFDAFYFYLLDQAGYEVYDWDVDSGDSRRVGVPAGEIIREVKKAPLRHEMNVLLHDGSGHAESVKALPEIIRYFKDLGYSFAPLTEKVKPAQFGVTKLKWKRSLSLQEFNSDLLAMRAISVARGGANAASNQEVPKEPQMQTASESAELEFTIRWFGTRDLSLGKQTIYLPSRNLLKTIGRSVDVPLRAFAEKIGATVNWDENKQLVSIQYGMHRIEYDTLTEVATVKTINGEVKRRLSDVYWKDERLIIPLDRMLELLGMPVLSIGSAANGLQIALRPQFDVNQHFPGNFNGFVDRSIRNNEAKLVATI